MGKELTILATRVAKAKKESRVAKPTRVTIATRVTRVRAAMPTIWYPSADVSIRARAFMVLLTHHTIPTVSRCRKAKPHLGPGH